MRKPIVAAALATALLTGAGQAQTVPAPVPSQVQRVTVADEPLPPETPKNEVSPGSFVGTTAAIAVVVIGITLLSGLAFMGDA